MGRKNKKNAVFRYDWRVYAISPHMSNAPFCWPRIPEERHLKELRVFFAKYDLVASANYCFSWAPSGMSESFESVRAMMKVPFECLVGIRKSPSGKTSFWNVRSYDVREDAFFDGKFSRLTDREDEILRDIEAFLSVRGLPPVEIGTLSETSRGHGFGFSWTFATALSTALFEFAGESGEKIGRSETQTPFSFALSITKLLRYDGSFGVNCAAGLEPGSFFLSRIRKEDEDRDEKYGRLFFKKAGGNGPLDPEGLPLDCGIVFSGLATDTKAVEAYKSVDAAGLERFSKFLREELGVREESDSTLGRLARSGGFSTAFSEAVSALSVKTACRLTELRNGGYREDVADGLVESLNQIRYALSASIDQGDFAERFRQAFRRSSLPLGADIGLFPLYGGKTGGGFIFVAKPQAGRTGLERAVREIREHYPQARVEYANFFHGNGTEGARVRQNLFQGEVAPEMRDGGGYAYCDNLWNFRVGNLAEVTEGTEDGILLNQGTGEIVIRGEKVNSSQIKSQNATIELLAALITKKTVANTELPVSSYSKSRSEMQSKILWPLGKITAEQFGKRIEIVCSGSLSEFVMELEDSGIRIGLVRKLAGK